MGGCRCTYRNCTVKTDGKTHMFHYPVFEKFRCHQWLVNAQKLEFLNLKVSQLKNRVVCQHHFKEDKFMNYMTNIQNSGDRLAEEDAIKKSMQIREASRVTGFLENDKLTFDAIPTEDGPYCDTTKLNNNNLEEKPYSNVILLEDIESDYLVGNKKSNFSLKYGDFLTNGELMDSSAKYNSSNVENAKSTNYNNCFLKTTPIKPQSSRLSLVPQNYVNHDQIVIVGNPSDSLKIDENISRTLNKIEINKVNVAKPQPLYQEQSLSKSEINIPQISQSHEENRVKKESKVKILSETKINWPLPITGKFEKISPRTLLTPEKKYEPISKVSCSTSKVLNMGATDKLEVLDVEFIPKSETDEAVDTNVIVPSPKILNTVPSQPSRVLPNKSKLTPERTAAIEKKRKFNMKMKNVIESCLNQTDDPLRIENKSIKINTQKSILKDANVQASTNPAKDKSMKNFQECTIAFLENRMNEMEEKLLSRIDQNSQNIMELNSFFNNIKSKDKKLVDAQTNTTKECYKKFLYHEISPYLSENAKNVIYEELFINKYSVTPTSDTYSRKRRKVCV